MPHLHLAVVRQDVLLNHLRVSSPKKQPAWLMCNMGSSRCLASMHAFDTCSRSLAIQPQKDFYNVADASKATCSEPAQKLCSKAARVI